MRGLYNKGRKFERFPCHFGQDDNVVHSPESKGWKFVTCSADEAMLDLFQSRREAPRPVNTAPSRKGDE